MFITIMGLLTQLFNQEHVDKLVGIQSDFEGELRI